MGTAQLLVSVLAIHYIAAQKAELQGEKAQLGIINGEDAKEGEFPFMVRLTQLGQHLCGGSLIRPNVVLTAAHCVNFDGLKAPIYVQRAVVGDHTGSGMEKDEKSVQVIRIISHEDYYDEAGSVPMNDVALLVLKEDVTLKEGKISTISLAEDNSDYEAGTAVTVIGWGGHTEEEDEEGMIPLPDVLQKLEYQVADGAECKEHWRKAYQEFIKEMGIVNNDLDTDDMIDKMTVCTIDPSREATFWKGDSGGPLFVKDKDTFRQIGIASWGGLDPSEKTFNMYANVYLYKDWIESALERAGAESWIELSTGGSDGIVLVQDRKSSVRTICGNDVGRDEVAAICRELGYKMGATADVRNYMEQRRGKISEYVSPYGYTKLKCKPGDDIVMKDCEMEKYEDTRTPCFNGEQLAVKCANKAWEFKITRMQSVTRAKRGFSRGRVMCRVHAEKYGRSLDMKNDVQVSLVIRGEEELRTIVSDMKYRVQGDYYVGKFKPEQEVKVEDCFACVAFLPGSMFHAVGKIGPEGCPDNGGFYEEWLKKQNLQN